MNNDDIFREFWANYRWQDPQPISYRLYHDDSGTPVIYTMENLDGKYIEVTREQYVAADYKIKVVDGKLVHLQPVQIIRKLKPGQSGVPCHPSDVTIVMEDSGTNTKWQKR